jgi:hypothetical protein
LLLVGCLGAVYCGFGVIMAADFSVACDVRRPEDCVHWRSVAIIYEWLVLGSLTAVVTASIMLVRLRGARRRSGIGARAA